MPTPRQADARTGRNGLSPTLEEIQALGAFDGRERRDAMDMFGFKKQLVFATHSVAKPFSPSSKLSQLEPKLSLWLRPCAQPPHERVLLA